METKTCKICSKTKPITDFCLDKSRKGSHKNVCKECHSARCRKYISSGQTKAAVKNRERWSAGKKEKEEKLRLILETGLKECSKCKKTKPVTDFQKSRLYRCGFTSHCKDCHNKRTKDWTKNNKEHSRQYRNNWTRDRNRKLKQEVIAAYGGFCSCCGENTAAFLSIDHIYNDGAEHRKNIGISNLYKWLKKNGFPKDRYQLLCFNCNMAKGFLGECPHKTNTNLLNFAQQIPADRVRLAA